MPSSTILPVDRIARASHTVGAAILAAASAFALIAWTPSIVIAQSADYVRACLGALAKDRLESISNEREAYAWYIQISNETFEEHHRNASGSVQSKIPLVSEMIGTIKASGDYSKFDQERRKFLDTRGYQRNDERDFRTLQLTTSPRAYDSFDTCIKGQASVVNGPSMYIRREFADEVHVELRNFSPDPLRLRSTLSNGKRTDVAAPAGKAFKDGEVLGPYKTLSLILARVDTQQLRLTVVPEGRPAMTETSTWARVVPGQLAGHVEYDVDVPTRELRGQAVSELWTTPYLVGETCRYAFGTPLGGRWIGFSQQLQDAGLRAVCIDGTLGAEKMIWVRADTGLRLETPRLSCEGGAPNQCTATGTPDAPGIKSSTCAVLVDERQAFCLIQLWGKARTLRITAAQYAVIPRESKTQVPILGFDGTMIRFSVPKTAIPKSALVQYEVAAGRGTMVAGEERSFDGRLRRLTQAITPTETVYVYAVDLTPKVPPRQQPRPAPVVGPGAQ